MKTTNDKLNEILALLKGAKYELKNQDEFGYELASADGIHTVQLQQTTITFRSVANKEIAYSFGASAGEVKAFLKNPKSFDEADFVKPEEGATEKPKKEKKAKAVKEVKAPKEKKAKVEKPVVEKEERGPSIRQEVLKLIEAGAAKDVILAHLKTTFPEREEADLKNKISLYKGYHAKGQRSKGYVAPVSTETAPALTVSEETAAVDNAPAPATEEAAPATV
jgi:hypothetical protein